MQEIWEITLVIKQHKPSAETAKDIADLGDMKLTVFDRDEFTQMAGGLAGVAQGTDEPPKFIILEYNNGGDQPKILVVKV